VAADPIAAYFAAVNEERYEDVASLFAPTGVLIAPGVNELAPTDIPAYLAAALKPYPKHEDTPTRVIRAGRTITVEITFTGELANGAPFTFDALDVFDLDADDRIVKLTTWYDSHLVRKKLAAARER
jgi:ketosteroid isomerase-like protein